WCNSVNFIDENNRRRRFACLLENISQPCFCFTVILVHDFRTVYYEKIGLRFRRKCLGNQCLAATRRAVHQNAAVRLDSEPGKDLWMAHRELDYFPQALYLILHAANLFISYPRLSVSSRFGHY